MYPVDSGIHGFLAVQVACLLYVTLTLGITVGLWWLGIPTSMGVVVFVVTGAVLLVPFWPLFAKLHPKHDDN